MASAWGNSWGVAWGSSWGSTTPAAPPLREVAWPIWSPNRRKFGREKEEEDRAKAIAELATELEVKRSTEELWAIERSVQAIADEQEGTERKEYRKFLASLRWARLAPLDDEHAQRIALQIGTQLAEQMAARLMDEDAVMVLLLSD